MTWFKVDDGFYSSKKVMSIPRQQRLSAVGLWTMAGNWSGRELSDGVVPAYVLLELGATPKLRQALVTARLWLDRGSGGIEFHDWAKYQPTRAQVEAAREKERIRKDKYRSSQRDTDGTPPDVQPASPPESRGVSDHPDPTRPDPTNKEKEHVQGKPARDLDAEFEVWWEVYPRKQGKADALKAYRTIAKTVDAATLLAGVRAYALLSIGEDKSFLKFPAGWLRGRRWEDEAIARDQAAQPSRGPVECHLHEGYPLPCERCKRDAELPPGADF